ncbi:MAG TPA: hypothetical protein VK147_04445 [Candidatus Didemnitutus sp.]|nr:hypothetical protein [Candidatus Didemnitutus sp.]
MMKSLRYFLLLLVAFVLLYGGASTAYAQGTLTDSLVLRNATNGRTSLLPNAAVPPATPWYLVLPPDVGVTGSLLSSSVTGSASTLSWLPPGANNTVLTVVAGVPTWVAGSNWLLTGNTGTSDVTNFLGTTDAMDLILRSNNEIRLRVNQEFNGAIDVTRPTTLDGSYSALSLGMSFQSSTGYPVAQDNTRGFINAIDWGTGGPGGAAQTGTLFSNWTQLSMQRGAGNSYNDLVGDYFQWIATDAATVNSITGYWSERQSGALNNTVSTLYHFRAELPGAGTVTDLFGFHMGTPAGTLNNVAAFNANNIPTGAGNRYFLRYNASGLNQPFAVSADGSITSGTLTPLANSRMLITNLPATSGRAIDIDMTATTTSSGLVVRNIGATGSNDAGVLIGTAAAGTGTGIRIGGVATFNPPSTGIDVTMSSIGLNVTPNSTATGVGVSVGTLAGARTRIGAEFYSRGSGGTAYGVLGDANATAAVGSLGIAGRFSTSGNTGDLFPLVVSSANDADVYLGSTLLDQPAALASEFVGASNLNTTYMYDSRVSGSQIFVGSVAGTLAMRAPATVTTHDYILPDAIGATGAALRILSVAGTTATLAWSPEPPAPAPEFAYVTADQTFAVNALANVTDLVLTGLIAGRVYEFEALIAYDGLNAGADLQIAFVTTNTLSIRWSAFGNAGASVAPVSVTGSGTAITDIPTNTTAFGTDMSVHVKGLLIIGALDGTIQMQAATTTAGNQIRILQGSFIKATRMTN